MQWNPFMEMLRSVTQPQSLVGQQRLNHLAAPGFQKALNGTPTDLHAFARFNLGETLQVAQTHRLELVQSEPMHRYFLEWHAPGLEDPDIVQGTAAAVFATTWHG